MGLEWLPKPQGTQARSTYKYMVWLKSGSEPVLTTGRAAFLWGGVPIYVRLRKC